MAQTPADFHAWVDSADATHLPMLMARVRTDGSGQTEIEMATNMRPADLETVGLHLFIYITRRTAAEAQTCPACAERLARAQAIIDLIATMGGPKNRETLQ